MILGLKDLGNNPMIQLIGMKLEMGHSNPFVHQRPCSVHFPSVRETSVVLLSRMRAYRDLYAGTEI